MSERRTVVVGGGLAGITAALDLAAAGALVTLVEVRPRLGGAAYSFERDGLWLDNGQHVFLRCCTDYRRFLDRIGATQLTTLQDRLSIPVLAPGTARPAWLRRSALQAPLHLARSLLTYRHLRPSQRLAVIRGARALARVDPDDPAADAQSFGEWLSQHGQDEEAREALWELIGRPTLNLNAGDASLAAAAFVFRVGLLESAPAGDVGYATVPLQRVHGDPALTALAAAGADVRLGWRAEAIELRDNGGFTVAGQGERLEASAVVLAVPHQRAARLVPEGAVRDPATLERLGTSPIVNLHFIYDRPVLDLPFAAAVRSPLQYVFDRTRSAGLERGQCLAVSLSAADAEIDLPGDELEARYSRALEDLLPAVRDARLQAFYVTRERLATFRASPGARSLRPGARTGLDGLALAGAWTDTGWPATMEGAVRSGHAAAQLAVSSLGLARGLPQEALA